MTRGTGRAEFGKWPTLLWLALATLLAMATWFSASAVVPALTAAWDLDEAGRAGLTMSVQLGFVVGALGSALLNLADRVPTRRLFAFSALLAAAATALVPIASGLALALPLRFLTGLALVGVYPVGMRIVATWTRTDRGLGIGLLVGAITLGNAMPHLLNAAGGADDWRRVLYAAAALAVLGALIAAVVAREGPYATRIPPFDWRQPAGFCGSANSSWSTSIPRPHVGALRHAHLAADLPGGQLSGERPRPGLGQPHRICRH